jgi:sulfate adenylyltransferase large subunit
MGTPNSAALAVHHGVLRFITAGSVDDGKSTLIGRLLHDTRQILEDQLAAVAHASRRLGHDGTDLSLLTDGLEAEREQGITIDVAYRYFATPRRKFIIADTPGHEQYTRNMATAASNADAAVLLADATKGLQPQGRRHLTLAHLLGIRHLVVAVNKMDLVAYAREAFEAVRGQFERYAAPLGIGGLAFVPVSALAGGMVVERGQAMRWYAGPTLLGTLEALKPAQEALERPLRLPVQLVQRPGNGEGRAYLGRMASGAIAPGAEVICLPAGRRTRVRALRGAGPHEAAFAGDSVAITLQDELDLGRGDLVADPQRPPRAARALTATLVWFGAESLVPEGRYLVKHTTRTVRARVAGVEHRVDVDTHRRVAPAGEIAMNDIARVALELQQPVFCDAYRDNRATGAFILIEEATNQTVAAGMIE